MAYVKSWATMYSFLEWVGEVPDDVEPSKRGQWIKDNICGGEFSNTGCGDWSWDHEPIEVDKEDYEKWISS